MCGPCSPGYEGNGIFCRDINECEVNNGGCSLSPKVQCINTEGSHHCGTCPPGWAGDGKFCTPSDENTCVSNNLCHPEAKCQYISNTAICICPDHLTGTGFGPSGCVVNENHPCKDKPCRNNGTCIANGQNYTCLCKDDYYPPRCERKDPCSRKPCQNGGVCTVNPNQTLFHTCTCPEGFAGSNCERLIDQCGGFIHESTGLIKYPFDGNYHPRRRCIWVFYMFTEKVLNLTFPRFDLEEPDEYGDCSNDFLQLHDGLYRKSRVIGRFCGNKIPRSIITPGNNLFMIFSSNNNTEGKGFEMSWTSIDTICGGHLTKPNAIISSPGFPGKALRETDCKWTIEAPFGKRILFKFFTAQFRNSSNCTGDSLIIADGKDGLEDSLIAKICATSTPQPILSTSHIASLSFHTDAFNTDSAFRLHYEIVDQEPDCGGVYSDPRGAFNIITRSSCEFLIRVHNGLKVKVTLESQDTRDQSFICSFNYLNVFDGSSPDDPLVEKFCLGSGKKTYTSSDNVMLLKMTSKIGLPRTITVTYETGGSFSCVCLKNLSKTLYFQTVQRSSQTLMVW